MTLRKKMLGPTIVLTLAAGVLAGIGGLFGFNGPSLVSAQANTTAPTILSVAITSDPDDDDSAFALLYDDGVYGIGDEIEVTVTFSENVTVTGSPRLELTIGSSAKNAVYKSAAGSKVVFGYTVASGDSDTDGISIAPDKLTLNGGTIKDAADNAANLSQGALSAQSGHKVDGIRPTITTDPYFSGSTFSNDGVHTVGEYISAWVGFSEEVIGIGAQPTVVMPLLGIDVGGTTRYAKFVPLPIYDWRDEELHFLYQVVKGDLDLDGISVAANSVELNGGTIRDAAGNDAVLTHSAVPADDYIIVDGVPATVESVAITSDPGSDNTYGVRDTIEVTVTFSEAVFIPRLYCVQDGQTVLCKPRLELNIGGEAKTAIYKSHSGAAVAFSYRVQQGDDDADGISIGANKLIGYIWDDVGDDGGEYADLTHDAVADDAGHKVATLVQPPKSRDATLSALSLKSETSLWVYAPPDTTEHTDVANYVSSVTVTALVNHSGASYVVKLGGVTDSDGTVSLAVGSNVITVVVTAEDGSTTKTYTVTVTRAVPSTDATLSYVLLSGIDIGAGLGIRAYAQTRSSFTASVYNSLTQTTVTPTVNHSAASYVVKLGGVTDADGVISLAAGSNVITIEVTAEDGQTTRTYTVTVNRATASAPTTGELSTDDPPVNFRTVSYTHEHVYLAYDNPRNRGITGHVAQRYKHDGDDFVSAADGRYEILHNSDIGGYNTSWTFTEPEPDTLYKWVVQLVNSQNATVIETSLSVRTPPEPGSTPLSSDATLSDLTLSGIDFDATDFPFFDPPGFYDTVISYVGSVANSVAETTVTATTRHSSATYAVKLGGVTDADGTVSLAVGSNVITVEVTAEDGETTRTYTVTVTRVSSDASTDATLRRLVLSDVDYGTFAPNTTTYTTQVANSVAETLVTPNVSHWGASYVVKLGGVTDFNRRISLAVGSNVITVEVTAEDLVTTKTYTIAVTRAAVSATAPDLVVSSVSIYSIDPSFTLGVTVENKGSSSSGSTTLRYYLSADSTITNRDVEVGTDAVEGLAASGSSEESINLTAPSSAGTFYYGACVDTVTSESDTTNNCSAAVRVTVTAPDLVVDAPTVSDSSPLAGTAITLSARVRNQGNGAMRPGVFLRYYSSTDDTITTGDNQVGRSPVRALNAGDTSAEFIRLTAPSSAGTYYYGACVGTVTNESDTTNNCSAAVRVTVTAPDLVVDRPTVSAGSPLTGASFTLSAAVRNNGGSAAGSTILRYYRSSDDTISESDTSIGTDSVSGLNAGGTSVESISVTVPSSAGTYYYGACVDAVTNESDTTNNCSAAVRVSVVAPPDLVVGTPRVSDSNPVAGMSFTLSATVRNQGGSAAGSSTLRYYRSRDATIATNDSPVGTDAVSGLGAGASSAESIRLTAPATTRTYYYGTCVDAVSGESDTANNCSVAVAVTVGAAPAPDLVVEAPTVSSSSPLTGASFTLSAMVRNQGSAAAGSTTLTYYRSTNATIDTNDTSVGTDAVSGLPAGNTSDESISLTAPATAGTYYYGACVGSVTNEFDTANNCSAAVTVTVGVAPVFSEGASTDRSVVENSAAGTDVGSPVMATDADNDTLTYSLEGTDTASFSIVSTSGQIQTSADLNYEARSSYSVTVMADDGKGGTDTIGVTIRVTNVNEPPTVIGLAQLTVSENDEGFSETYSAGDPDGVASTFTWSVAGTDGADFDIDGSTGELTFRNTPDYESPADSNRNNEYLVTVRATDEGGLSGSLDVTVTVEDFDEPPTITGSATPPDFPENSVRSVATYQATDPEGRTITWDLSGTDSGDFEISDAGALTFKNIPDFEKPTDENGDNEYLVTVEATDEGINTSSLDVTVTVINSTGAEEPTITASQPSLTLQENGTGTIYTFRARDPQGRPVDWSLAGADESNFTISGGALTFISPPDFEVPTDANGDNVYELTVVVTDDQGLTDSFDFTVTVTNHHENQEPAITTRPSSGLTYQKLNYQENRTSTVHTYRATNYGPGSIRWSLSGADYGSFDISERGALTFQSAPNHEALGDSNGDNDYEIAVVASNSGGYSDSLNVVITVTDVNEGPEVTGGESNFTIYENQDLPSARYTATDPEGGSVTRWSLGGSDGGDFNISQEGVLTFRSLPDYERPADSDRDNVYQLQVRPYDGRHYGSFDVTVTVNDVNEWPTITTTSGSATGLRQNENVTSRLYTYRATDPEGSTVTWSVGGTDGRFFAIDVRGQFSFKEENPPDFEQPADSDGNNVYDIAIQVRDYGGNTASLPVTVAVRDVNEGPEISRVGSAPGSVPENQDQMQVLARYTATDPEGGTVSRWRTSGTDGGDFVISEQGELRFRNTPDYERPADSNRDNVYVFAVQVSDGRYYGAFEETVTVTPVNERPIITTTGSSATALRQKENLTSRLYTYRATDPERGAITWSVVGTDRRFFTIDERGRFSFDEGSPPDYERPGDSGRDNVYDVTIQAHDDGGNTVSLPVTVTVTNDAEGEEPTISTRRPPSTYRENGTSAVYTFRASEPQRGPITWSLRGADREDFTIVSDSSGRGTLAFSSPPDYENPVDSDRQNDYELTVIATDEDGHSDRLSFTFTVTDVDEGPEVSGPSTFTIAENGSLSNAVYTARDPEGLNVAHWSVGGRDGGDFFITQGGTLYFRSLPDYERPADSDRDNVYEVTIQPSDGRNSGSYPVTVTVTDVNEPPEIRSGSTTSFTQQENRTSRLYTYSATDPEGSEVSWSVGGTDGRLFTIDERGQFSFSEDNPPDFDAPADEDEDNVYSVTVQAKDSGGITASLPVTVTVTEVNEGPVITRDGNLFGSPPGSVPENHSVTQVLARYTASDPERPSVRITQWSAAGTDGGDFTINALGELRFRNSPDYERPADGNRDNVYEVTIRASDGRLTGTLEDVQVVTVTDVNEPPTITTTSRTAFTLQENRTSTLYTFRATDPEGETVNWTAGGTDGRYFTMDEHGALSFANAPDYDAPEDADRNNEYDVTVQATDDDNKTAGLDIVVTVTDHNEGVEPTITTRRPPATYRENGTSAVYTFRATDPQRGAAITWTLEGRDKEDFTLAPDSSGRGVLLFISPPDFEDPDDIDENNIYELAVVATDGDGNSDRVDFTITVTDHNEGVEPTISTRRPPATYRENGTSAVYTFRTSDPQSGTTIIWSVAGTDSGEFAITADTSGRGVLTFNSVPDFENPADRDTDNVYELSVVAADGDGNSDRVDFAITVTDVNEGPVIRLEGTATTTVPENTPDTWVLADYTATDPEDPTANVFHWSAAGRDGGDFVVSELGELRFRNSPDYERPADGNRDNVYEVTVRASDGRVYGTHDVTVTVVQVNEAPVITTKSRTEFSLRENSTSTIYTYRATDQDEDDAVRWSLEGADGGDFAIYNGILNFRLLPDLENPVDADEDNVYEITVVAADRAGLRDTVGAVITITDQSEGPIIAGRTSYSVAENYDIAQALGTFTATDAKDGRTVHPRWSLSGRDGGDFTINEDGELTFRNTPDYDRPADSDRDNVYELTVRGHDSQAYGDLNITVTVTNINEAAPVITGRNTHTVRENTDTAFYTFRATDSDLNDTIAWSVEGTDGEDFTIDGNGALSFGSTPDYEAPVDSDSKNVYALTVVATDSGGLRGTFAVVVNVTELNEGPTVSGTASFTVNENNNLSNATYTAADPEATGGVTTNITWSTAGRDGGDFTIDREIGVLTFRTLPDHERPADADRDNEYEVTVRAYDGRNYGTLDVIVTVLDVSEITGPTSLDRTENFDGVLATYAAAGRGALVVEPSWRLTGADSGDFTIDRESGELTFRSIPDHERPADSNRDNVYRFTVQVSDDSYFGTLDVTVTVTPVNEPPAITGRNSLSFRENTQATTRLHTYSASDPEGEDFTWHLGGLDAEDFNITTDSRGRGVLTFASPPNFDSPDGSGAHGNEYLVTVQARDAQGETGELPVTVTVTDQNEGAVVTGQQTIAVQENRDPTLTLATYLASDPEGQPITRWSLSGSDGGDFLISENGELTFRNIPDYDRPADSNRDNEYRITVRAYDGRTYGNLDVTVTVSNVNEHDPVIRSGSRTSFSYREEGTSALYTYRATDGDKDDVIAWSTGGSDGGDFTIDGETGELTFRESPDYEDPRDAGTDNVYELAVVATDSGGRSASLSVTVTVTELNEGPEVSGATTYTVSEGQQLTGAAFTATDPEDAGAAVTGWRLAGSDAGDFTIIATGQNSAQLTFRNTPDYDRPADSNRDNEYLVTIRAYNGSTYGSLDVTVTVTDQNEAEPVVTGRETLSFRENTSTDTRLYTYRATDKDRGATLTWSVEGTDGGDFTISTGGELFFSSIPDHEQAADSDFDNVYVITVVASDGTNRGTMAVTVTVTDVNEGPEITGIQSLSFAENTASDRVLATYTATDPEDPDLEITRWSVTGPDGGDFAINEDGDLTFRNPPDHERPADSGRDNVYEVTVRASDGRMYGTLDVTVTVEAVDEAPEFRSGSRDSFSYRENGTAALYTYRATDPEGAEVAWSVSGADGGAFTIDRNTGVLNFREPPDHDNPADDGRDNEYQVTVVATDQTGHAASQPVTVTVTDVNEGPVIADTGTNTSIAVEENHDQVLATYTATDPEDPNLAITRWSVTSQDGGDFTINEDGELTFRSPPDHERPADSNRDNTYEVTIRASDGRYYGTLDVTIIVQAVDEAPEFQRNTQDTFVYQENGTSAIYTYRATDPEGSDVTWRLSGSDGSAFSIGKTGVLTFNSPPDYEDPTDSDRNNVYELTVEASDEQSKTARLEVTVTVTNLTDARAAIRGTAQVGRTLTAQTYGITDKGRRSMVDFSYQWLADDKDVEGATDSTYEITE